MSSHSGQRKITTSLEPPAFTSMGGENYCFMLFSWRNIGVYSDKLKSDFHERSDGGAAGLSFEMEF
jgi:hypothetical protein